MEVTGNCRICNSPTCIKWESTFEGEITSESFAITDCHYGQTAAIHRCTHCGFLQCHDLRDLSSYYENLKDLDYEKGRRERTLQANALLRQILKHRKGGKLLDVGAGSGVLVEAALNHGFEAKGIDPSTWLCQQAQARNLPVNAAVLEDLDRSDRYQVLMLVDVIEHVEEPLKLLEEIHAHLDRDGIAAIVTPDCRSFFARVLGHKWWHYRVAHVGYFDASTLKLACEMVGLEPVMLRRPGWYFTMDYLWVRLMQYFPTWMRLKPFRWMQKITIPLNLRDSLMFVVKPRSLPPDESR